MHPRKAFNETMKRYKIKGVEIANKTGLSESYVSKFRSGKAGDIGYENFFRMINALPKDARHYFLFLCMSDEE